jgi:uncharacterized protein YqeY
MLPLRASINDAFKSAMKNRDEVGKRTLSFLNAAIRRVEVDERRDATETDILEIINKGIKQRRETIAAAEAQGRADIAEAEKAEIAVLQNFLPAQLTEAELVALIDAAIAEAGATSKKDLGKVMTILKPKIAARADGGVVSKMVGAKLP